jgi:uncharacterized damage-inducible protein DinB
MPVTGLSFEPDHARELLARTPGVLSALLNGLPDAWLLASEGPETFSAKDVVGHLIHGEETDWVPRLRLILEHGESRPFEPFDRLGFREKHREVPVARLLRVFAERRAANLAFLDGLGLKPADFDRRGTHPALGPVTLRQLLATWVVHDLDHLGQVARVLAKQYKAEVGPWVEYLGILTRWTSS